MHNKGSTWTTTQAEHYGTGMDTGMYADMNHAIDETTQDDMEITATS